MTTTTYGYRLYKIELRRGFGQKSVNFDECDGQHYLDVAEADLKNLTETSTGKPRLRNQANTSGELDQPISDSEPEDLAGEPAFRIERQGRTTWLVHGAFFAGRFGEHEIALGAPNKADDTQLTDRAPSRLHRFILALPESGTSGILAIESLGRTCPVNLFTSWLARTSQRQAEDAEKHRDQSEKQAPLAWWKLQWTPLSDNDHLDNMLKTGEFNRIELIKHKITPDNRREAEYFRLVAPSVQDESAAELATFVKGWINRKRGVEASLPPATDEEAAGQLASIFGTAVEELDFDDGFVVIEDADGRKSISPSRLSEVFIYPLSKGVRPADDEFYRAVRAKARSTAITAQVDVAWPVGITWDSA